MIPSSIRITNEQLPDNPGVYFYYDVSGTLLYVGKATSLKKRVGSYFVKAHDGRIAELVSKIARIDYVETPTVIEALVLEANKIKALKPYYNILQRDDKSFLYLVVTNEEFPRPLLMRGLDLERLDVNPFDKTLSVQAKKKFLAVFGPYTSGTSLKRSLEYLRRIIPWSDCTPPVTTPNPSLKRRGDTGILPLFKGELEGVTRRKPKPCFNYHLGKCPGVCIGAVSKVEYRKIIRKLILFFEGKKPQLIRQLKREMNAAAKAHRFEEAAKRRNDVFALEHIRDVALITKEDIELPFSKRVEEGVVNLNGRIEAYDISNISGTSAVGSMVVFEEGKPAKHLYRKFKIKTVKGANDFAMMEEVLRRRLGRAMRPGKGWELPEVMVIDGGEGQLARVYKVFAELLPPSPHHPKPKILGIAKGFDRKQDRLVYDRRDRDLVAVVNRGKELFQRARDEAHRFAVAYHRKLRSKKSLQGK